MAQDDLAEMLQGLIVDHQHEQNYCCYLLAFLRFYSQIIKMIYFDNQQSCLLQKNLKNH